MTSDADSDGEAAGCLADWCSDDDSANESEAAATTQ